MDLQLSGAPGRGDPGVPPGHRGGPRFRQSVQRYRLLSDAAGEARRSCALARAGKGGPALRAAAVSVHEPGADPGEAGAVVGCAPRARGSRPAGSERRRAPTRAALVTGPAKLTMTSAR